MLDGPSVADAEKSLQESGVQPLAVQRTEDGERLYFGKFAYYAEGLYFVKQLKSQGYFSARMEDVTTAGLALNGEVKYPRGTLFKDLQSTNSAQYDARDARIMPIYEQMKSGPPEAAMRALDNIVRDEAITPPSLRGWAMLRQGYLNIKNKNKAAALPMFKAVADGTVPATKADRIDAAIRVARLHHSAKERVDALQAYTELLKLQEDPKDRGFTLLQIAGLKLELARSAKGSFEEVREACQEVLKVAPSTDRLTWATAELMYLESYVFQPKPQREEVIRLANEFMGKYKDQRKLYGIALYFRSTSQRILGRTDEAREGFTDLLGLDLTKKEMYASLNVNAWALLELAVIIHKNPMDVDKALKIRKELKEAYPDSKQAKMVDLYFVPSEIQGR